MRRIIFLSTLTNWGVFTLLYLFFLGWHGAFEGPLSPEEIDLYIKKIQEVSPEEDPTFLRKALQQDRGKPIVMVNAIKMRDKPLPIKGKTVGNTSEEVLNTYSRFVIGFLIRRGSYPLYVGTAVGPAASTWGIDNAEEWSTAALVRYRSLRTLVKLATHPEFNRLHEFKFSAIEKTIAYPTHIKLHPGGLPVLVFFILLSMALTTQLFLSTRMDLSKP